MEAIRSYLKMREKNVYTVAMQPHKEIIRSTKLDPASLVTRATQRKSRQKRSGHRSRTLSLVMSYEIFYMHLEDEKNHNALRQLKLFRSRHTLSRSKTTDHIWRCRPGARFINELQGFKEEITAEMPNNANISPYRLLISRVNSRFF